MEAGGLPKEKSSLTPLRLLAVLYRAEVASCLTLVSLISLFHKGEIDMASIGGVRGNNMTSSLYNSANVISGLASGLDT